MKIYHLYKSFLEGRRQKGNLRELKTLNLNEKVLNFVDNDYLSLKNDKFIKKELIKRIKNHPLSISSSRLLYNGDIFSKLETHLAKAFNQEACLVFSSGFQLNQTVIAAILDKNIIGDRIIFCDKSNHSSIYEGINFQKKDQLVRYENCNLDELEKLLEKYKDFKNKFVFTESLFSMDGKILNLKKMIELKKKYNFFLFIDDCHATGVFGRNGYGLTEDFSKDIDLIMGSLSKVIPAQGGFIVCNDILKEYIINNARGFIYSSALSLPNLFIAEIFFENINKFEKRRKKLLKNCKYLISKINKLQKTTLKNKIQTFNYNISPIVPLVIGDIQKINTIQAELQKENILISNIKSPTVFKGSERVRLSLKFEHSKKDLDFLIEKLMKVFD